MRAGSVFVYSIQKALLQQINWQLVKLLVARSECMQECVCARVCARATPYVRGMSEMQ